MKELTHEQLTELTGLADTLSKEFDRAWAASMTQDDGKPDETEQHHQTALAIGTLQKINNLIWPDQPIDFMTSEVAAQTMFNNLGKDVD